jgi:hypothetical protein
LFFAVSAGCEYQVARGPEELKPQEILERLMPEVRNVKLVTAPDLEPNPEGIYRRHAFIVGDFNQDGIDDVAIAATDQPNPQGRNGYVLIASKAKNGNWTRVFVHKFDGVAKPFLIWDRERIRLLVGANETDFDPGDIVWDHTQKGYKLIPSSEK